MRPSSPPILRMTRCIMNILREGAPNHPLAVRNMDLLNSGNAFTRFPSDEVRFNPFDFTGSMLRFLRPSTRNPIRENSDAIFPLGLLSVLLGY